MRYAIRPSLHSYYDGRAFPQLFQAIEIAHRGIEEMNDDAVVIQQDPARVRLSFDAEWQNGILLQLLLDVVGDCFHLPFVVGGGDDEIIGEERNGTRVQQQNIRALFVGNQI